MGASCRLRSPRRTYLETAVKRELTEETSLVAKKLNFIGTIRDYQTDHSEPLDFIHFAYHCPNFAGQPKLMEPDKCEGWQWFDQNNLPDKILLGHLKATELFHTNSNLFDMPGNNQPAQVNQGSV